MSDDVELIRDHLGPAAANQLQDQLDSDDERAVTNFHTTLRYGVALNSGTIVDYVKGAYAVRVNGEDPADQPNWSAASKHIDAMVEGNVDRTCMRCDRPVYSTYTEKLCREHFQERVGPDWGEHIAEAMSE